MEVSKHGICNFHSIFFGLKILQKTLVRHTIPQNKDLKLSHFLNNLPLNFFLQTLFWDKLHFPYKPSVKKIGLLLYNIIWLTGKSMLLTFTVRKQLDGIFRTRVTWLIMVYSRESDF